jgi:hypothetical protein
MIEAQPAGLTEAYYERSSADTPVAGVRSRNWFTEKPDDLQQLVAEVSRFASAIGGRSR